MHTSGLLEDFLSQYTPGVWQWCSKTDSVILGHVPEQDR